MKHATFFCFELSNTNVTILYHHFWSRIKKDKAINTALYRSLPESIIQKCSWTWENYREKKNLYWIKSRCLPTDRNIRNEWNSKSVRIGSHSDNIQCVHKLCVAWMKYMIIIYWCNSLIVAIIGPSKDN